VLPLSTLAMEIIDAAAKQSDVYVFSASGKALNGWDKPTKRLRKAAPAVTQHWQLHDFRRTFRTDLGRLGVDYHVAERCIDHVVGSVAHQTYDRWSYLDAKRDAMQRWADHLRGVVAGERKGRGGKARSK
jgi:integrase